MTTHLYKVLHKTIPVPVDADEPELEIKTVQTIFGISDVEQFMRCAALAKTYFQQHPEEKKLSRDEWAMKCPQEMYTPCSFLNTETGIFAQSRDPIGAGKYGQVNLAMKVFAGSDDPDQTLYTIYTVKVLKVDPSHKNVVRQRREIQNEARLGRKHGLFVAPLLHRNQHDRKGRERYYLIAPYKGMNLRTWIKAQKPTLVQRLDAVIIISKLIHQLHQSGDVSRDTKPENYLIDLLGNITMIDYGFAIELTKIGTEEEGSHYCGSSGSLPFIFPITKERYKAQIPAVMAYLGQWGEKAFDTFAYKRFFIRYSQDPIWTFLFKPKESACFPKALRQRVETENPEEAFKRQDSVLEIGACLVLYRYQLIVPQERLSLIQQESIMNIHFDDRIQEDEKRQQLKAFMSTDVIQAEAVHRTFLQEQEAAASLANLAFFKRQIDDLQSSASQQEAPDPRPIN